MIIRAATPDDASAITAIYNQGLEERRSTFETEPRDVSQIRCKLVTQGIYPYLVATEDDGTVLGWANISAYRPRACYAGIGEFSIYLDAATRGRGVGTKLLDALVCQALDLAYWKLLSRIFVTNAASRRLSEKCGFREVGIYEKHGRLDEEWIDVVVVERLITENLKPNRLEKIIDAAGYASGSC